MATNSWLKAQSGDWSQGADWSSGAPPGAGDQVTIAAQGTYTVTLSTAGTCASLTLADAGLLFYDTGTLSVAGTIGLQAGTLALAYGTLQGGTLSLAGGTLRSLGGTLAGSAVQGTLDLSAGNSSLFVTGGLALRGAGGAGAGAVNLTGAYAALDFVGSQTLDGATVMLGNATGAAATLGLSDAYGATAGTTLTLGPGLWVRQGAGAGVLAAGTAGIGGPPLSDALLNRGTITASGGTLTVSGPGTFTNAGTIGVSGGAVLDVATAGFVNTGTISVAGATLDFGGTFASGLLGSLGNLTLSHGVLEIGGTDQNAGGTLSVGAGLGPGPITLAGTITGGTVADAGGGLLFGPGTGVLAGVTYQGTLALTGANAAVTLTGNTVLTTAGGVGTASVTGAGAALLLEGVTGLNGAVIALGSVAGTAALGTADALLASQATTATLGSAVTINHAGGNAAVNANAQTPIPGVGLSDTLVNQGTINAAAAGGTLTLGGYGTLINAGRIAVSNGDTVLVSAAAFSNTGSITVSAGSLLELGAPGDPYTAPQWSNSGVISLAGGTLALNAAVSTPALGSVAGSGTVSLLGTLVNAGSTLTLGSGLMLPDLLLSGTITGGAITDRGGLLTADASGAALLDGVSYAGTLGLTRAREYLRIRDGLTLAGVASVTGAGAVLAFQGSETLDHASVLLGAAGTVASLDVLHDYGAVGGSTLTLGAGLGVTQAGALAAIGLSGDLAGDAIVNAGTIAGAIAQGTLTLGGAGFANSGLVSVSNGDTLALAAAAFSNSGTLAITNATLEICDTVTLAQLGALSLANAAVTVAGTLNAAGGTLTLGAGSAWGRLGLTGTILGGTIVNQGGGLLAGGAATLNGVTYQGALDLSRPFQNLAIANGITLTDLTGTMPGTVLLTGPVTRLAALGNETIDNAAVYIGDASLTYNGMRVAPPELVAAPGSTLTLGPNANVRTASLYGTIGDAGYGQWTDSIVNGGTILAGNAGGTLTLGASFFLNSGALLIGGNDNVVIGDVSFTNRGQIAVSQGSSLQISLWNYYAAPNAGATPFTNAGTLKMTGGVLAEMTGNGLFPAVPLANLAGGLIQGLGTVLAPLANNGTIEASYNQVLALAQAVTGTGTLLIDPGSTLELAGPVAASQTVSFSAAGETLKLDLAGSFAAAAANYGAGDVIDLTATPLQALALSAGTLVATSATGNFRLNATSLLSGELSGGPDGKGGTDITYTPQPHGSAPVAIPANAPAMLFWASPVGDTFTGAAANLTGARIGNWGVTDALDITDMAAGNTQLAYAQGNGQGVLTVTDGSHSASITIFGTLTGSYFHAGDDGHGGALITYHP